MEDRTQPNNPYYFGMGLPDPGMFVGRETELKKIVHLLAGPAHSCVSLLGATRMGKTTLLDRTMGVLKAEVASASVRCVPLTLLRLRDRETMFEPVVTAICGTAPNLPKHGRGAFAPEGFLNWLDKAISRTPTVLFIDDFDDLMAPDELRFEFYNTLRAAARNRALAICVATRHPLQDLCRGHAGPSSLLWNIFTTIDVGLVGVEDLRNLIFRPHSRAGLQVAEEEWEIVLAEAGPQACLAQIAGYHLFEAKQQAAGRLGQEQLYRLSRTIHREVSIFFPVFLEHLKSRDSGMIETALRLAMEDRVCEGESDRLAQLGVVYRASSGPRLMSEAFRTFLVATAATLRPVGAEMNVAVSKRESLQSDTRPVVISTVKCGGTQAIPEHQLLRRIGGGAFGEVWLARTVLGRYRAVKVVRRYGHQNIDAFEIEFHGLQRYEPISRSHEGLVHVLQIGRNDVAGFFYYVMELADDQTTGREINPDGYAARTLKGEIANRGCVPVAECLRIGLSLSAAIAHIHKHGLIHRDIKPANVVFVNDALKLADIGLVADAGRVTYAGTPGFIPKEGPGRPVADIYSVGKLLYEAMTGLSAKDDFPRLPPDPTKAMQRLNQVILKACEDSVQKRYQSGHELHAALARLR